MLAPSLLGLFLVTAACADNKLVYSVNKGVIVHLFEWKWTDIAEECKNFLGPQGFAGVQISPPNENIIVNNPPRPWWERYQPISYKLDTRSGTEDELKNMVRVCNKFKVRVFVDAILNHMTGPAQECKGTSGSEARPDDYSYPAVPFTKDDFHPQCSIVNYDDAQQVRNCQLVGLRDLDGSKPNVREKQLEYLNKLIKMGVAGFRIDAAKHIWPDDLKYLFDKVNDLNIDHGFKSNTRPLIYMEFEENEKEGVHWNEYSSLGLVTDFQFGNELGNILLNNAHSLAWLKKFGNINGNLLPKDKGVVFVENHDTQRDKKPQRLNYQKFRPYKMAVAFMLAYNWGTPNLLSGYNFKEFNDGPPHDEEYRILSPKPSNNNICANGWTCEHRWRQVYNMVRFHNVVAGTDVEEWWDNGKDQISFCRGKKGFIAFNKEPSKFNENRQTCLRKGKYCDVISGSLVDNKCTGKTVEVKDGGFATVEINPYDLNDQNVDNDGVLALHVQAKILDETDTPGDGSGCAEKGGLNCDKFMIILQESGLSVVEGSDPSSSPSYLSQDDYILAVLRAIAKLKKLEKIVDSMPVKEHKLP